MNLLIEKIIRKMFEENWSGESTLKSIDTMKKQLHKNLNDQLNGYWSGHTAYYIMTKGGFLIDGKSSTNKQLTPLGEVFIEQYNEEKQ
ncbi:hypothetical protein [Arcobacter sp.]|uniref:hypothetical protein n=1 Tax=unclassified Arcobacter TaxID=2593671 RepID=UPI003AFFCBF9